MFTGHYPKPNPTPVDIPSRKTSLGLVDPESYTLQQITNWLCRHDSKSAKWSEVDAINKCIPTITTLCQTKPLWLNAASHMAIFNSLLFLNAPTLASFSFIFGLFQTNNTICTANQCKKMSCPSSIRRRDSDPRPLGRESPPITTRPGLPHISIVLFKS